MGLQGGFGLIITPFEIFWNLTHAPGGVYILAQGYSRLDC